LLSGERRIRTTFKRFLSGSHFFSETSVNENLRGKTAAELRYSKLRLTAAAVDDNQDVWTPLARGK
jgi:hypothetical protein